MNKRIKELRTTLGKNQEDFGKYLGLSKSGVSEIEAGRRNVTDQHIIMLKNCSEFSLNEEWLRTGEGEMFNPMSADEELSAFVGELIADQSESFKKRLISALTKLRPEQWDLLEEIIDTVNDMKKE